MIHREGHTLLFTLLVLLSAINVAIIYFFPTQIVVQNIVIIVSLIFYLFTLHFFRNPRRVIPQGEHQVIAPADGKVVVIEETQEPEYLNEKRIQVSIFMSPLNVHVNRNPIDGTVEYFKYHKGKYLVAWHPKSSTENERTTLVITSPKGIKVLMRQIAGAVAKRIKWYVKEGQPVAKGAEFGFIKFGSRVDVFLPLESKVQVKIGDKTVGGETIIAELPQ
ncbi:MAG: phosphatidylserine decarboxylase family protein [Thermonemataceae bacterium]